MNLWKTWLGFFTPLSVRNLQVFWSGQVCSLIGMWLQVTAMGILVYELSGGSAKAVGLLAALNALPFFLGGMYLGALGDRFERRIVLIWVQRVQFLLALILFVLSLSGYLASWQLYMAGFIMGVAQTISFPAQQAFVGDLVPKKHLQDAIGMYSLVFNTCRSIGPALGGYLIASWGATYSFLGNVALSVPLLISLAILARVQTKQVPKNKLGERPPHLAGLKVVLGDRGLLMIMISALIQNVFAQSLYQIVPAITYGNAQSTGILLSCVGAGAVTSLLLVMPFARKNPKIGMKLSMGTLWMGAMILIAGLIPALHIQAVCFFLAGLATSSLFVTSSAAVQWFAPSELKSSVLGLFTIVTIGVQPLAALGWGAVIDVWGVSSTLATVGGVEIVLSCAMLTVPFWRQFGYRYQS